MMLQTGCFMFKCSVGCDVKTSGTARNYRRRIQ